MSDQKISFKNKKDLEEAILQEKVKGTSDLEIGQKYGVTFRYIEKLITKSQGVNISALNTFKKIKTLYPKDFKEEQTTVWSFKQRGNWATHSGEYRGNWSPYIPRNVILKYSKPEELILDYFCGAGTTAVEAKLLGRRCIAVDINDKAIELAKKNVDFKVEPQQQFPFIDDKAYPKIYEPKLMVADARNLFFIENESIDLICAHPPYANIIHYTDSKKGDLSFLDIDEFLQEMVKVAKESFRVLKYGRQCAILIGDLRRKKHVIPLGFKLIDVYLAAGFKLKELIIKRQHNCKTTGFWYEKSIKHNFLLLAHEYLPIFEKPDPRALSTVKEEKIDYISGTPIIEKLAIKRKLNRLETTTVWILPDKDFEEYLNKNVIDRYSNGDRYSTIIFTSRFIKNNKKIEKESKEKKRLLFIKSPFLNDCFSISNIDFYLQKIKEIIHQNLPNMIQGGFIVIQTKDVRINGYVEPIAKRVVDTLQSQSNNLWLKEIVVIIPEEQTLQNQISGDYLRIVHQYLLVYEVVSKRSY